MKRYIKLEEFDTDDFETIEVIESLNLRDDVIHDGRVYTVYSKGYHTKQDHWEYLAEDKEKSAEARRKSIIEFTKII